MWIQHSSATRITVFCLTVCHNQQKTLSSLQAHYQSRLISKRNNSTTETPSRPAQAITHFQFRQTGCQLLVSLYLWTPRPSRPGCPKDCPKDCPARVPEPRPGTSPSQVRSAESVAQSVHPIEPNSNFYTLTLTIVLLLY